MICPNCGNEIENGHVLCEKCGLEIQMVPSFDAELELQIDETMSGILDGIDIDNLTDEQFEYLSRTMDFEATAELKKRILKSRKRRKKASRGIWHKIKNDILGDSRLGKLLTPQIIVVSLLVLFILIGVIIGLTARIRYINSPDYLLETASDKYREGDYAAAQTYYEKLLIKEPDSEAAVLGQAKALRMQRKYEEAATVLKARIETAPSKDLYTLLVEIYEETGDVSAITALLNTCPDDIASSFTAYVANAPTFDHDEGEYQEELILKIMSDAPGHIYYTDDGSEPTKNSEEYFSPLTLLPGKTVIRAIFENEKGVLSDSVTKVYVITSATLMQPVISPESGTYDQGQYVTAAVPEGCRIYYTTDGTVPTEESSEYSQPLLMPLGDSTFRFICVDLNGKRSDVKSVHYSLNVVFTFGEIEAINYLLTTKLLVGDIIDIDGSALEGGRYYYDNAGVLTSGMNSYMIFEETYSPEGVKSSAAPTGEYYAVENISAGLYRANRDEKGLFKFMPY